jgi:hypothetical protein
VAITIPAAIVAACAVALLGTVAARDVVHQVGSTELTELSERGSKYQVWGQAAPMIAEHRWLGVGRGSFEPAFTRRSPIAELTYSHVENSYLQAAVDWGVPIALALALAVLALGRAALRRWRHGPLEAGALGALTAVAVHELADFSLELPVVAMATLATAAVLAPSRLGTGEDRHAPVSRPVLLRRLAAVVVAVAIIGLAALPLGRARRRRARRPPAGRQRRRGRGRHPGPPPPSLRRPGRRSSRRGAVGPSRSPGSGGHRPRPVSAPDPRRPSSPGRPHARGLAAPAPGRGRVRPGGGRRPRRRPRSSTSS